MKLKEIHESHTGMYHSAEEYTRYLENNGHNVPKIKGKKGFVLVVYSPKGSEKTYKTLGDAEKAAPKERGVHWQIFDGKDGNVASEPEWILADQIVSQVHRGNY